jgi:two-component SAPR family response regulator
LYFLVAQDFRYGLGFNSFEVVQEKRTSLNLSPSKPFSFPDGFSLSFDICYQSLPDYNFGYVFRMIGQNDQHIDFLLTPQNLTVVNSSGKILADCPLKEISGIYPSFFPFSILLDIKNNRMDISIGEKKFSPTINYIKDFKEVNIVFGRCNYSQLQTSDVPNIIVKDIRINDLKGEPLFHWKLSKHTSESVNDELKKHPATVENPGWLLDDHAIWQKRISFNAYKNPQIAGNPDENCIAVFDKEYFYIYNTQTHNLTKSKISSGIPHSDLANQIVYNPLDKQYYSYCFNSENGKDVTAFDATGKIWENYAIKEKEFEFWHHNKLVLNRDSSLYLFGGYGHHKYKNYINKYSFKTQTWEKLQYKGHQIQPRYLSGLGKIDENRILLFGGYGSETGQQELSPRNYYDLFEIDLRNMTTKKIWELGRQKNHFVVANSMIVDTLNKYFYALCFPQQIYHTSLFLGKFSMEKPEYEILTSIPFNFRDISSYADLFLNEKTNELSAITYSSETSDSMATVSVYSLSYPPLAESDIHQTPNAEKYHVPTIYGITALFCLAGLYFIFRKKKNPVILSVKNTGTAEGKEFIRPAGKKDKKRTICLFGGFRVNDKNGVDITSEFSPLLKQLFLIILLNTLKEDSKGISSTKLKETLWFDKSPESARNNRGVMLSKLRQIFEQIGSIHIESQNSYCFVEFGGDIYCDYYEALVLIRQLKQKINRNKEDVLKLISIVSGGELLPNIQMEWLDTFKADFANDLIDLFIDINTQKNLNLSLQEYVNLADAILVHDTLNEDALKLKCSALVKMGKNGLAKSVYLSFTKKYTHSLGTKFKYSFEEVVS